MALYLVRCRIIGKLQQKEVAICVYNNLIMELLQSDKHVHPETNTKR